MMNVDRRQMVLGMAAGLLAPGAIRPAGAQTQTPADGPLSAGSVADLLAQHKVPGVSLAIIDRGELVAAYGYGLARKGVAVTPETRFQAASISKSINALGVMRLVQDGKVALDTPVNQYLKSWKLPDNDFTRQRAVTVRMLLSHTGGISVSGFNGYVRGAPLPSLLQILDGEPPANNAPVRVIALPGATYSYSGGGTTVLQQMVIDVTGEPYPDALQRLVLGPLGMSESSFVQPPLADIAAQAAFGHVKSGEPVAGDYHIYPELAAAGLWTTPRDLTKFVRAIIAARNGQKGALLTQDLATAMLTPVLDRAALGVFIEPGGRFWHNGGNAGFRTLFVGDPQAGQGLVAMTDSDNGEDVYAELRRRVAQLYSWR